MLKQQIRNLLLEDIPEKDLELWFDPLLFSCADDNRLQVMFPHQFFHDWFQANFKTLFEARLALLQSGNLPVYSIKNIPLNQNYIFAVMPAKKTPQPARLPNLSRMSQTYRISQESFAQVNPASAYSFENFLHNSKNQFPVAAAKSFSRLAAPSPFIIYGENGCGKTHILASIYKEIKSIVTENNIFFGKLSDLETIIENNDKQGHPFFHPFFEKKALLIDNFQDCGGRPETQKRLLRLMEYCSEQTIAFAAALDVPPSKWSFMEKRLRSLLESGLIIEIKKPDLDIKTRYIQERSLELNLKLKKDDVLKLARMYNEFRQIQGALLKIISFSEYSQESKKNPDLDIILKNSQTETGSPLSPKLVLDCVAESMQLMPEQILGKGREHRIVQARHLVMYLLREMLAAPLTAIGNFMGKDHSSVLYSINKIHELSKTNKEMNKTVTNLKQMCLNRPRNL